MFRVPNQPSQVGIKAAHFDGVWNDEIMGVLNRFGYTRVVVVIAEEAQCLATQSGKSQCFTRQLAIKTGLPGNK